MNTYTIGQLSEISGVSRKALLIYEKKGLLLPSSYSTSHYRLYDENAKSTLQQIMTMKFLGYSLEQIKSFMEYNKGKDIELSLKEQRKLLQRKKEQLDTVIACVDRAILDCPDDTINFDSFTNTMKAIVRDRKYDEGLWQINKHINGVNEWTKWVFDLADIEDGLTMLDIGCGYGNLWRENWSRLPEHYNLVCLDKKNTWADTLYADIKTSKLIVNENASVEFIWGDAEEIKVDGKFDRIFLNHVISFINNPSILFQSIHDHLQENGIFICTWGSELLVKEVNTLLQAFDSKITTQHEKYKLVHRKQKLHEDLLRDIFPDVNRQSYMIELDFTDANECYSYIIRTFTYLTEILNKVELDFINYLDCIIEKEGKISFMKETYLYKCSKNTWWQ